LEKLCAAFANNRNQKRIRMRISQACLDRFKQNKMDLKRRFITVDETWT
ncbi:hypothetical protein EAI_02446, partial [Harpegnathos saltator]